jgi:xanthine dehydrogenase YagT iron-sulfur-binding subunit
MRLLHAGTDLLRVGLIAEGSARTADEIRKLMSGNICRCGG